MDQMPEVAVEARVQNSIASDLLRIRNALTVHPPSPLFITRSVQRLVDTAMVIVCAMNDSGRLTAFIARPDTHCDIELCASRLRDLGCPHVRLAVS